MCGRHGCFLFFVFVFTAGGSQLSCLFCFLRYPFYSESRLNPTKVGIVDTPTPPKMVRILALLSSSKNFCCEGSSIPSKPPSTYFLFYITKWIRPLWTIARSCCSHLSSRSRPISECEVLLLNHQYHHTTNCSVGRFVSKRTLLLHLPPSPHNPSTKKSVIGHS